MRVLYKNPQSNYVTRVGLPLACLSLLAVGGCGSGLRSSSSAGSLASPLAVSAAPKLGYAWNQKDKTLRPIVGVPGAAQFGESVTSAGTYEQGAADPTGSFAVLLGDSQSIYTMSLPSGAPVLLSAKAAATSQIIFSPQGTWAFVFPKGGTEGQLLTQLSGTSQSRSIAFTAPLADAVVSDAGTVAAAQQASSGVAVQVTATSGTTVSMPALKGLGGMSFIAGTEDLLLADAGANSLLRVRSASTSPASSVLATAGLLKSPVSIATSRTARWAVIANGGDASVVRVDLSGSTAAQRTVCACQPSLVSQLSGDGAFRLTALQDGPVWIGDASKPAFPVLFIPSLPGQAKVTTP